MGKFSPIILPIFLLASFALATENASFFLKDGRTVEALFIIMKHDTVYVQLPNLEGKPTKKAFHKSVFFSVMFPNGRELDLSKSNSPPELNHRSAYIENAYEEYKASGLTKEFEAIHTEIAVNNLTANGLAVHEAVTLTDILRAELGRTGKFRVLERAKMSEILEEQGFQQSGACDESSCIVEMGQLLGVKYMVVGNVGLVGGTYSISVRLIDVATGEIIRDISELHRGNKDKLLSHVMPGVAWRVAGERKRKGSRKRVLITSALVAGAAAIAVPIVILTRGEDTAETTQMTPVEIRWDD